MRELSGPAPRRREAAAPEPLLAAGISHPANCDGTLQSCAVRSSQAATFAETPI